MGKKATIWVVGILASLAMILSVGIFRANSSDALTVPIVPVVVSPPPIPLPVVTVTKTILPKPRPVVTKTVINTVVRPGPTITRQGPTVRVTVTPAPSIAIETVTQAPKIVRVTEKPKPGRDVQISVPKAIGISVGLLLAGMCAALAALYLAYIVGFKDSEKSEASKLRSLQIELFGKKDN